MLERNPLKCVYSQLWQLQRYVITHRAQLIKFIIVGFTAFGIYFASFHFIYGMLKLDYKIATSVGYVLAVLTHFSLHRFFTFKAHEQAMTNNVWRYVLMLVFNYLMTLTIVWAAVNIIQTTPYVGLVMSTAVGAAINFFILKHFVFYSRVME